MSLPKVGDRSGTQVSSGPHSMLQSKVVPSMRCPWTGAKKQPHNKNKIGINETIFFFFVQLGSRRSELAPLVLVKVKEIMIISELFGVAEL